MVATVLRPLPIAHGDVHGRQGFECPSSSAPCWAGGIKRDAGGFPPRHPPRCTPLEEVAQGWPSRVLLRECRLSCFCVKRLSKCPANVQGVRLGESGSPRSRGTAPVCGTAPRAILPALPAGMGGIPHFAHINSGHIQACLGHNPRS